LISQVDFQCGQTTFNNNYVGDALQNRRERFERAEQVTFPAAAKSKAQTNRFGRDLAP